ncbi:MAG: RnfABCDGE type electron transport complex subunit D [Clostridiales bacterium]|nr:RnfABCDGE type electron transport complex subunit D [Clostridiales bacterium]
MTMDLRVKLAPHLHAGDRTGVIMLDVIAALIPTAAAGIYLFGWRAALVLAVSVVSSIAFEMVWQLAARKPVRVADGSAAVTGLLLGLNLPASTPLWLPIVGSAFAIWVVKQLFGGLGQNLFNPALAARGFLLMSWPGLMSTYALPMRGFAGYAGIAAGSVDAASAATALSGGSYATFDLLLGNVPGCIGEVSKVAILLGLAYLLYARVVAWRIPVVFTAATALVAWATGANPVDAVLSGGVLLGAVFMATDYASSPMSHKAQYVYAALGGALVAVIRAYGAYPEGVTFAILIANALTPLLDRLLPVRVYGR